MKRKPQSGPGLFNIPAAPLNPEQRAAAEARHGYFCVMAGPGSGKTKTLIERYKMLLAEGVPAEGVLALTFTASSAKAMAERAGFKKTPSGRPHGFMTLHSLALAFATQEPTSFPFKLAPFPLATEGQAARFAGEASRRSGTEFKTLRAWISLQKRRGGIAGEAVDGNERKLYAGFSAYEKLCRDAGLLDFDDLILEMVRLLESRPGLLDKWSYQYVFGDEGQDNDELQFRLLRLLSQKHGNLWVVGDVGQSVYEFRGSTPQLFLDFSRMFPGAETLYLGKNHRSTGSIVDFCRAVAPVKELGDRFCTDNEEGTPPTILRYASVDDEANSVADQLITVPLGESVAVLARTNRQLQPFEDTLLDRGIKYHLLGKSGFWQQPEIRAVLDFIQCAQSPVDSAVLSAIRTPFHPTKFLHKKALADTLAAESGKESVFKRLGAWVSTDKTQERSASEFYRFLSGLRRYQGRPAGEAVSAILTDLRAVEYYDTEEDSGEGDNQPVSNLQHLQKVARRFSSLSEFLDHVRKVRAMARLKAGVALGTVHAAKGLEWDRVFVVGVQEGTMPHRNAESLDEEKRIFFVAVSRPAKHLTISYTGVPSRFITQFLAQDQPPAEDDLLGEFFGE